jgi:hypothetical protein
MNAKKWEEQLQNSLGPSHPAKYRVTRFDVDEGDLS